MREKSFNVIHAAIVMLCVIVLVTVVLAMIQTGRRDRGPSQGSTQLRGVHQGLVIFAQSNKGYFPGLSSDGQEDTKVLDWSESWGERDAPPTQVSLDVDKRFAILLFGDYLPPAYLISPSETNPNIKPWPEKDAITTEHYSYAMLEIPDDGGRRAEWKETLNSQAIVVSDRNTGTLANPSSIHVDQGEAWAGHVLWNDNHVGFENSDAFETKYGAGELNEADHLFESPGTDDALLIHSGN